MKLSIISSVLLNSHFLAFFLMDFLHLAWQATPPITPKGLCWVKAMALRGPGDKSCLCFQMSHNLARDAPLSSFSSSGAEPRIHSQERQSSCPSPQCPTG